MLVVNIIELLQTNLEPSIVFVPNDDGTSQFCFD